MIAPSMVTEIRRLLSEDKLSQRKIAKLTGVSRGTIGAIASGKRPDYKPRPKEDDEFDRPVGPPERCPTCGGIVYMPCRLCKLRKKLGSDWKPNFRYPRSEAIVGMDLKPEHQQRYEEVRAAREEAKRLEMARIASGEMDEFFSDPNLFECETCCD